MKLWVDDCRNPNEFGKIGWNWAKTYEDAIEILSTGNVTEISLDHDLGFLASIGQFEKELTGYDILKWMEEYDIWPDKIYVHSQNPVGRERMLKVIAKRKREYSNV